MGRINIHDPDEKREPETPKVKPASEDQTQQPKKKGKPQPSEEK